MNKESSNKFPTFGLHRILGSRTATKTLFLAAVFKVNAESLPLSDRSILPVNLSCFHQIDTLTNSKQSHSICADLNHSTASSNTIVVLRCAFVPTTYICTTITYRLLHVKHENRPTTGTSASSNSEHLGTAHLVYNVITNPFSRFQTGRFQCL